MLKQFQALTVRALRPTTEIAMSLVKSFVLATFSAAALLSATAALASQPDTFPSGRSHFGVPNTAEQATKVVDVRSTKSIDLVCGETVTFRNGDKTFSWRFDTVNHGKVDARKVAPAGFMTEPLMVYVRANDYERN
jgi:hypothetical protein